MSRPRPAAGSPPAAARAALTSGALCGLTVTLAASVAVVTASPLAIPALSPMGEQAVFSPLSDLDVVRLAPLLAAPWRAQGSLLWGALVAIGVGAAAVACARVLGASWLASSLVWCALAASAPFASSLRFGSPRVIGLGLLWIAIALLMRSVHAASIYAAAAAMALAAANTPFALVASPLVLALTWRRSLLHAGRWPAMLAMACSLAIGSLYFGELTLGHAEAEMPSNDAPSWRALVHVAAFSARSLASSPLPDVQQWPSAILWVTLALAAALRLRARAPGAIVVGVVVAGGVLIVASTWPPLVLAGAERWTVWPSHR